MITRETSSLWMTDFHNQLMRGQSLIIDGGALDHVLLNGEYMSLPEFLNRYFRTMGVEVVGWYDIVDGFRLAEPNEMQAAFLRAVATSSSENGGAASPANAQPQQNGTAGLSSPPATSRTDTPWSCAQGQVRPVVQQTARPPVSGRVPTLQTPEQVLPVIRQALRQTEIPVAMIVDVGDKLFTDPKQQVDSERQMITLLKKITREAAYVQQGQLQGRKNCLVIIAESLAAVPPW